MAVNNLNDQNLNQQVTIIWADAEVNNSEDNLMAQQQLFHSFNNVEIFTDGNDCQQFIQAKPNRPVFLVVSGRLSRQIIPALNSLEQVVGFYIYCMNKNNHEEWSKTYPKIKDVIVDFDKLISKIQSDLNAMPKKKPLSTSSSSTSLSSLFPQPATNLVDELADTLEATDITTSVNSELSHIDGYQRAPLVSLEQAVAPLANIVEDVNQMVWIVKQNSSNPPEGLTADESASIAIYTMEWYPKEKSFFYILDEALRSEDHHRMQDWFLYLKLIFTALSKLQTVSNIIYRGVNENLSADYPKGKVFTAWEFLTCTAALKTLEDEETFGRSGQRTLFTIESRTGKDIRQHANDPGKDQVLLLPGRKFKVVSYLCPDDELHIIQLQEMTSSYSF